ncbi:MAG: N-acetylmuramoyl-L-alanine amidase AmiC precursor [Alphaproteobacteria bacterium ADurb.Bin438]|nr:MAG: N-acetylmuramoyl-L-alanine amidase AmiC precursor [Alphaproteobacteria bacterium ADurb.Bin438]
MFPLSNPDRLVIDINNSDISFKRSSLPKPFGVIEAIRLGQVKGSSRVVFEFNESIKPAKIFMLTPSGGFSYRLVIDVARAEDKVDNNKAINDKKEVTKKPLIVIDPGHGGKDPGAIGVSGIKEKVITLSAGLELRKQLLATNKYDVYMTRDKDETLSLGSRVKKARDKKADLFISLHADSIRKSGTKGLSVYTLSDRASDKEAEALADRENKADIIAGIDLSAEAPEVVGILIDLARRETMNYSGQLANLLVQELRKEVTTLPNTHRSAGFAVLKAPDIPSVLLEMGYLSNKDEEKLLKRADYRKRLLEAVVDGLDNYFDQKSLAF